MGENSFREAALIGALSECCRQAGYKELIIGTNWAHVATNSIMVGPAQSGTPLFAALRVAGFRMLCGNSDVPVSGFDAKYARYDNAYLDFPGGFPSWTISRIKLDD